MTRAPYPSALIFGVPGAGKGTQGDILRQVPGFYVFSSGHLFRDLDPESDDGKTVNRFTRRGELVPDDLTIRLFFSWIESRQSNGDYCPDSQLLLLDGLPRSVQQVELIRPHFDVKVVIHLVCHDEQKMIDRIRRRARSENREDDVSDAVIRRRFEVYNEQTAPVLDRYPTELVREVESTDTPARVLLQCLQHLVPVLAESIS